MRAALTLAVLTLVPVGACTAERPDGGDTKVDAATERPPLAPPTITGTPAATPRDSVALRGRTEGARVIVEGGLGNAVVGLPLPSGDFCLDVPIRASATSDLEVTALGDGRISPATLVQITQDPAAPVPANPNCGGTTTECATFEDCTVGTGDEDCDRWDDDCDLDCTGCTEDPFEPNDFPFNVPTLMRGTHDLKLCPCHDDWFAFFLEDGDFIDLEATFNSSSIDIDLKLFRAADAEAGTGTAVDMSITTSSPESIAWTATATGTYYLRVYSYRRDNQGSYRLIVQ